MLYICSVIKTNKMRIEKRILKKGIYYVGDPCYIFDSSWDKVISETDCFAETVFKLFGKDCCISGTAYGDGLYQDNFSRTYGVDAGLLGILPISMLKVDERLSIASVKESKYMQVIAFESDFEVSAEGGVFHFGELTINTAEDENDEDENDEEIE